ncbi:MAG: tRNA uridine-5-carboxymethylaminomethyl(34) synthesis GTPase MnmE [Ruminococcus sp.]|nr:tRNA uridine-5-carboxymethylaminomethyl(34) synthesis GTPase MnmE [Ruminococcus sp.]
MFSIDTIAAISTPIGYGGIAVIRISGSRSFFIADTLFCGISRTDKPSDWDGYSCAYGKIIYKDEFLDECILSVYKKPRSYTGEDVVEISVHGGIYSAGRILKAIYDLGVRSALPGEFTEIAVINGKTTLTQAEAVIDIIASKGETELRSALSMREGVLYKEIKAVSDSLTKLLAGLGVWADYPDDEDIESIAGISQKNIHNVINNAINTLSKLADGYSFGQLIKSGIPLCIAGKPNVGKSSIMNMLSKAEKSIVTDIPGTTRDVIENEIRLGDLVYRVFDTAGIHETHDPIEQTGTALAKKKISEAEIVLAVFDGSRELDKSDEDIIGLSSNAIAVINKSDLPQKINNEYIKSRYKHIVELSAKTSDGLDELIAAISKQSKRAVAGTDIILNERQYSCAKRAKDVLTETAERIEAGLPLDAAGVLIESALAILSDLVGESPTAAVTRSIFENFCVGK